jgi:hypothetical protein
MSKAHMQVHTNRESREKQPGQIPGPNWAETGPGRPPSPFQAQFGTPFDLATIQTIYNTLTNSHEEIDSSSTVEKQRREGHHSGEERVEMVD